MSNREKFKETFEQIGLSEEQLRNMENLEIQKSKQYKYRYKYNRRKPAIAIAFVCACVILSGMWFWDNGKDDVLTYEFVPGEITYYAAENEDENGIEQETIEEEEKGYRLRKEDVMVNNDRLSDSVVDVYVDEHGLTQYQLEDGSRSGIRIEDPEHMSVFIFEVRLEEGGGYGTITCFHGTLVTLDDRIYLKFGSGAGKIDITEDFEDGIATGKMEWGTGSLDGRIDEIFEYRVEGTLEEYTVDVWWIGRE